MTKKLVTILISLIVVMFSYVFIVKYDVISNSVQDFLYNLSIDDVIEPKINEKYKRDFNYETFQTTNNYEPHSIEEIKNLFFTILNNGWDSFTFYCPRDYYTCVSDIKNIANDQDFIALLNNYVNPYNSFINFNTLISGNKTVYITIDKLYSKKDILDSENALDNLFFKFSLNDQSDIDKIKLFHNQIILSAVYNKNYLEGDYASSSNKSVGVLLDGLAVCSGYADTMALMLDRANIPNFKVSSENHIWNAVYINNEWTHIDVTWDDDETNNRNRSNFFMITTKELYDIDTSEHTFNQSDYKEFIN